MSIIFAAIILRLCSYFEGVLPEILVVNCVMTGGPKPLMVEALIVNE